MTLQGLTILGISYLKQVVLDFAGCRNLQGIWVVLTGGTSDHGILFNASGIKNCRCSLFILCELTSPVYVVLYCSGV